MQDRIEVLNPIQESPHPFRYHQWEKYEEGNFGEIEVWDKNPTYIRKRYHF